MNESVNQLVIITGVSGAGKSTALDAFEDMGFFCVENLPAPLIDPFVAFLLNLPERWQNSGQEGEGDKLANPTKASFSFRRGRACGVLPGQGNEVSSNLEVARAPWRFALLIDCRDDDAFPLISGAVEKLREGKVKVDLLFLEAQDEVIIRRFRETRRPHPLSLIEPGLTSVQDAIQRERMLLANLRGIAERVIETSNYTPHELRHFLEELLLHTAKLRIIFLSFGFKYGLPHDADLVIDVRFLPNPHFVPELRERTGLENDVANYVLASGDTVSFIDHYEKLLSFLFPRYEREGKREVVVAVGCTGGKHRSVALAEKMASGMSTQGFSCQVRHRDVTR